MGTGWAVGSSVVLGASLVVAGGLAASPLAIVASIVAGAAWAFAIARGAYGSRGAIVALLAYDLALPAVLAFRLFLTKGAGTPGLVAAALLGLVALLTAGALVAELRERRGPIQWASAVALASPLLVALPTLLL